MKNKTRRDFLKSSLFAGAGLIVLPSILPGSVFGADEEPMTRSRLPRSVVAVWVQEIWQQR